MENIDFAENALNNIFGFVEKLKNRDNFSFKPALDGVIGRGHNLSLGFSTYGLKLYYMLGEWDRLDKRHKDDWCKYINSFQANRKGFPNNSYIDEQVFNFYSHQSIEDSVKDAIRKLLNNLNKFNFDTNNVRFSKAINAETKQAIATLAQVGYTSDKEFIPQYDTPELVNKYLYSLDWSKPWTSGAQWSSLCVYSSINSNNMNEVLLDFIDSIVDKDTGSYFVEKPTHPREIINGAMKILSGLDWVDSPINYPEKLIDFCLTNKPVTEGCDIVDYIYVLYRCGKQTDYKKEKVILTINDSITEIVKLYDFESYGFSYFQNKSQDTYYGLPITSGKKVPDIHGTLLCTWALIMALDINEKLNSKYKIIKP